MWIPNLRLIRGLLIMGFPRHGWTQIDDLLRVGIDEEDVFVGVGFLLAAVGLLLFGVIFWPLAAAFAWRATVAALDLRLTPMPLRSRAIIALRISGMALSRNSMMSSFGKR